MREGTRHDLKGCEGCRFKTYRYSDGICNYLGITGRSRLASGGTLLPGGGCVLKELGEHPKRLIDLPRYGYKRQKTYTEQRQESQSKTMLALYELGYSDPEIGEWVGKTASAVQAWRKRRLLPPNCEPGSGKRIPRGKS